MPAACSLSGRLSTRNASTTMSWVEEAGATRSAASATKGGERAGSVIASSRIVAISSSCENRSQPRRRPNAFVNNGTCSASTNGAHKNFREVGAGLAHPDHERRARQCQRKAGGKAEEQDDQHTRLEVDGKTFTP